MQNAKFKIETHMSLRLTKEHKNHPHPHLNPLPEGEETNLLPPIQGEGWGGDGLFSGENKTLQFKLCNLRFGIAQQRGFSLVELLVAMAIASVLGMAGVALFSTSNWTYKVNEDVSEAQQNVRVAMEWLAKDIRTAGFGLEDTPTSLDFGGGNFFTAPITVTNSSTGPDTITILGIGYETGVLENNADDLGSEDDATCNGTDDSKICLDTVANTNNFFSSDLSTFKTSRRYISLNGTTFIALSNTQTERADKKLTLGSPSTLDKSYADGTPVYIIQAVTYSIVTNDASASPPCTATNPCLRSQDFTELRGTGSQTFAENIEDLQFAYGIDVSPRDGKIDDYNADGSFTTADFVNDPADDTSIVAVRANVVAKTGNIDMKGGTFTRPAVEDRAASSPDGYRRRLLTKIIKLRNPRSGGS